MSPGLNRLSHTSDSPWRLDSEQDETFYVNGALTSELRHLYPWRLKGEQDIYMIMQILLYVALVKY